MTELTPHLIEGLMSNIPPQQDFRRAVTIVSADPGSVVYQIEVPESRFGALSDRYCQLLRECVFVSATILTNDEIFVTNAIESSARKRNDRGNGFESESVAAFARTREVFGSRNREPSPKRKRGRARKDPPSFNARTHHQRRALTCARTCRSRTGAGDCSRHHSAGSLPKPHLGTGDRPEAAHLA